MLYKKNVFHLLIVFLVWCLFYTVDSYGIQVVLENPSLILSGILNYKYHLWFLPYLIGIYLFFPLLHYLIHRYKKLFLNITFTLFILWAIVKNILYFIPFLFENHAPFKSTPLITLLEFIGYCLLGYFFTSKPIKKMKPFFLIAPFLLLAIGNSYLTQRVTNYLDYPNPVFYEYFSMPVILESLCLFLLFQMKNNSNKQYSSSWLSLISNSTLGIYLIHPFILEHLANDFHIHTLTFSPIFSVPLLTLFITFLSFIIIFLLMKIPLLNKWIL